MDYKTTATKNLFWVTVGQIGTRLLGAVFFFYLAFKLGDDGVGVYSFLFSFLALWFTAGELGLFQYLNRKWARTNNNWEHDFSTALFVKVGTSFIIFVLLGIYLLFQDQNLWLELFLVFIALFLDQIRALQETYFTSQNKFKTASSALLAERIVETILGIAFLYLGFGLKVILLIYIVGRMVAIWYQQTKQKFSYTFKHIKLSESFSLIKSALPFTFIGIFAIIYFRIDMVMLKFFEGFEVVGWYSAAYRFIELLGIIPGLFISATFPLFSRMFIEQKHNEYSALFKKTFKYLFILAMPTLIIGISVAKNIIGLFYTASFEPAVRALQILLVANFLIFLNYLFIALLSAQNKEKKVLMITGLAALLNIVLNVLLIPRYSLYGAAIATALTEGFNLAVAAYFLKLRPAYMEMAKTILVTAIVLPILIFASTSIHFTILATVVFILYSGLIYAFKIITKNEINFYLTLIKEKINVPK